MKRLFQTVTALCMAIAICKAESGMIDNATKMKFMELHKMLDDVGKTINMQIDRVKLPISNVHRLGHCIHNHPFTDEDKLALEPFRQYMKTIYVTQDQIINWLSSFSPGRYERYSSLGYIPAYLLNDEERRAAANLMLNAIEEVKITSVSVNEIFANSEIKSKLDEIESNKKQLIEIMDHLTECLEQALDKNMTEKVMSKSIEKIAEVSKKLVEMSESMEMLQMMDKIAKYVNEIAEAMKDFPLNLNMIYML